MVESTDTEAQILALKAEVADLKGELVQVKEQLAHTENSSKIRLELMTLRKSLEMELWNNQGINKQEMKAIKSAIKKIDKKNVQSKNFDELSVIRRDVKALKEELMLKGEKQKLEEELSELKKKVAVLSVETDTSNNQSTQENDPTTDSSERDADVAAMKSDIELLKQQLADQTNALAIKEDIAALKASLKSDIMETKERNREVFDALREAFANFQHAQSDLPDSAVQALTKEVKKLKEEVEEQNRANQELEKLQREVTEKLHDLGVGDDEKRDLAAIKKAVDAVAEFEAVKDPETTVDELASVHESVKLAEAKLKSSKDLQTIKRALDVKLILSDDKSEQLEDIISVIEKNVELKSLAEKSTNGKDLKAALEATRRAVRSSELYRSLTKLEAAVKDTRPRLSRSMVNYYRREIDLIKKDVDRQPLKTIEEKLASVRDLHDDLVKRVEERQAKNGLRKFLGGLVPVKFRMVKKQATSLVPPAPADPYKLAEEKDEEDANMEIVDGSQISLAKRPSTNMIVHKSFQEEKEMDPPPVKSVKLGGPEDNSLAKRSLASKQSLRSAMSKKSNLSKDSSRKLSVLEQTVSVAKQSLESTPSKYSLNSAESEARAKEIIDEVKELVKAAGVLHNNLPASSPLVVSNSPKFEDIVILDDDYDDSNGEEEDESVDEDGDNDDDEGGLEKVIGSDSDDKEEEEEEDDILDWSNVSVSMIENELGETDIETVVELHFDTTTVPLTMSI